MPNSCSNITASQETNSNDDLFTDFTDFFSDDYGRTLCYCVIAELQLCVH